MKNSNQLKKIEKVFQQYGISLKGRRKFDRFDRDLRMDKVFVSGLIFELEYQLKKEIADEKIDKVQAPFQLIRLLMT